ncbi:MAG: hypothetical protein WCR55_05345 [Lentisphaerota bacterium]
MRALKSVVLLATVFSSCLFVCAQDEETKAVKPQDDSIHSSSIFADNKELYKLCSLYCYATRHEDGENQLKKDGWDIKNVTWDKTFKEILSEIKSDPAWKNCLKATPLSQQIKKTKDNELISLYDNYEKNLNETIDLKQHYGFVLGKKKVDNRDVYVMAFRGTDDLYSWIFTDFVAAKTKFLDTNTYVHMGFEKNRQACMKTPELRDFLDDFKKELDKGENPLLIITGHSLGGAVAVLESAYLVQKEKVPYKNIKLITSGEATPGKESFVKHFAALDYTTFINTVDLIPYILVKKIFNYRRLKGNVFYFTDKKGNIADHHLIETYKNNIDKGNYELGNNNPTSL